MSLVKTIISFRNCPPCLLAWITKLAWLIDQGLKRYNQLSRGDYSGATARAKRAQAEPYWFMRTIEAEVESENP